MTLMTEKTDRPGLAGSTRVAPESSRSSRSSLLTMARERAGIAPVALWSEGHLRRNEWSPSEPAVRGDAVAVTLKLRRMLGDVEPATILFSGLERGEGASTAALAIARALAHSQPDPVLLVDADLRRPSLAARLERPKSPGLAELVRREADLDAVVQEIAPGSLYFLPAGIARDPVTLLAAAACGETLRALRLQFGNIVLDTPPIGRSVDAGLLAAHAHYVTLVLESARHRAGEIREIRRELTAIGVGGIGVCLATGSPARRWPLPSLWALAGLGRRA